MAAVDSGNKIWHSMAAVVVVFGDVGSISRCLMELVMDYGKGMARRMMAGTMRGREVHKERQRNNQPA